MCVHNVQCFIHPQAAYHGVPVVCIPIVSDQRSNCVHPPARGWGVSLNLNQLGGSGKTLVDAIQQVQGNRYKIQAQALSKVLRAAVPQPTVRAAEWVEFAARAGSLAGDAQRPPEDPGVGWFVSMMWCGVVMWWVWRR